MTTTTTEAFYALSPEEQLVGLERLANVALTQWEGVFARVTPVKYRENAVFSVHDETGKRYALRIHRHGYHSEEALLSELHWMRELSVQGILVPPVVPTKTGEVRAAAHCADVPEIRHVDLLEWVDGEPIGTSETGVAPHVIDPLALYERVGRLAANVHDQVSSWKLPTGFTRHAWDKDGLLGDDPVWGRFWELPSLTADERTLIDDARARARKALDLFGQGSDRYGLIHADFVPENLLDDGKTLRLIDFDDSGYGWHMFELATALYFNLDSKIYPQLRAALFRGYRSIRTLPPEHEALLPLFLFLRGTTYMGWLQTRPETQTAQEIGPLIVARTCDLAREWLAN